MDFEVPVNWKWNCAAEVRLQLNLFELWADGIVEYDGPV